MKSLFDHSGSADISVCGKYRYWLRRTWNDNLTGVCFVMLNPSTADAEQDDPTIKRCMGFAESWGFGSLTVVNLFALRSTNPQGLYLAEDPIGPMNDHHIEDFALRFGGVVAAWGTHGNLNGRDKEVMDLLRKHGLPVQCLGTTKGGHPKHPLYLAGDTTLVPFKGGKP